jgi:hypothetical protein
MKLAMAMKLGDAAETFTLGCAPAENPFAAWCVIRLNLRSCSPSPFGPSLARRQRADTNSIAQCF